MSAVRPAPSTPCVHTHAARHPVSICQYDKFQCSSLVNTYLGLARAVTSNLRQHQVLRSLYLFPLRSWILLTLTPRNTLGF